MSLLVTPGQTITEPITLAQVKSRIRLTATSDDALITSLITTVREFAERVSRRSLAYKSYILTLDGFPYPYEPIRLPSPPLISIAAISYYDNALELQTWATGEYWVAAAQDPALIVPMPGNVYPATGRVPGSVQISFSAGWGYPGNAESNPVIPAGPSLPQVWAQNLIDLCAWLYDNPGAAIPETLVQIPKIYVF